MCHVLVSRSMDCCSNRTFVWTRISVVFAYWWPAEEEVVQQDGAMEPPEDMDGRTFVEVMSEKYSPENFPYRRGPGMGVVVVPTAGPQGSPMKGELGSP